MFFLKVTFYHFPKRFSSIYLPSDSESSSCWPAWYPTSHRRSLQELKIIFTSSSSIRPLIEALFEYTVQKCRVQTTKRKELQLNLKQEVCEDSGGASFFLSLGVNLANCRLHFRNQIKMVIFLISRTLIRS